ASMRHRRGEMQTARLLCRHVFCSNYSPIRRYYIARNGLVLSRESRSWPLLKNHLYLIFTESVKALLFERQKYQKLWLTARGVRDGIVGKLGRLNTAAD